MALDLTDLAFNDTQLTVLGEMGISGRVFQYGHFHLARPDSTYIGLTAYAGGGQANATALGPGLSTVTTVATTADSVKLPATQGFPGTWCVVFNKGANAMNVYPASGHEIDALGANNPFSIAAGASKEFWAISATAWYSK